MRENEVSSIAINTAIPPRTLLENGEGDVRVLHFDLAPEIHVRKALDDVLLTPLRDGVIERGHEELERGVFYVLLTCGRPHPIPFVDLLVGFSASVEFAYVSTKLNTSDICAVIVGHVTHLIRMHRLASSRAWSSLSSPRIMNGRDMSWSSGKLISNPYSSEIESSSGIRNSSCT